MALSTIKPATSPRLSTVKLDICSLTGEPIETVIAEAGNDLRRIADEIARIEREFEGAVNFIVALDSRFKAALDSLNVRFRFVGWEKPRRSY